MELTALEKEIERRTPQEQDRLAAFLSSLRAKRDPEYLRELDRRLDDRSPDQWLTLDELKHELS